MGKETRINEFTIGICDPLELEEGVTYWALCVLDEKGILMAKEIRETPLYVYVGPTDAPSLFPRFWKVVYKIIGWIRVVLLPKEKERKPEDIAEMLGALSYLYCFGSDAYIEKYYDGDNDRFYDDMTEGLEWLKVKGSEDE